jgi:hypothetical protein
MLQQTTDANLTTTEKNQHAQDDMHGMTNMVQCNLPNLSGIEIPTHNY